MAVVIRPATAADADALFPLAAALSSSFAVERGAFDRSLHALVADDSAALLVAEIGDALGGYLLGFDHFTFYANGRVAWIEEILVVETARRGGIGAALDAAFESWARDRGCRLVALATRRAAPFYLACGYEESASYFRKLL